MYDVIDFHHHLLEEDRYADRLIERLDQLEISKVCVSGLGIGNGKIANNQVYQRFNLGSLSPNNEDVAQAIKKYPDRIIGMGFVNLGKDSVEKVDELVERGFCGLKVSRPAIAYNDDRCFPIYARAEQYGLPILFHTGIVLTTPFDKEDDVCSLRMQPAMLDRVARCFPKLHMIIAHLGVPWFDEAAIMMRFHENIYADFTGSSMGWRNRFSASDFQRILYWEGAFDKVIFGTDTNLTDMAEALTDYKRLCKLLNLSEQTTERIFSGNAKKLLHLK